MTADVVLVDAGRSAVVPDGPGVPETPSQILDGVVRALLDRSGIDVDAVGELFLADPRYLPSDASTPDGWTFEEPPLNVRTTVSATGATALERAVAAVGERPDLIAVVAASDFGSGAFAADADDNWFRRTAVTVANRWEVGADEVLQWIRSSFARSIECSLAGDFAREIVTTAPGYLADTFGARRSQCPGPARGSSAVIVTSRARALDLGLRWRAGLDVVSRSGVVEPLDASSFDAMLAPCGVDAAHLDQLELPEDDPITPVAWIKSTGISRYLVNPRGGELGFGRLARSGPLRSLVSMVGSLEATGGRSGALIASDPGRTVAVVVTVGSPLAA
ncbi:hypothetical protein nbrc107696_21380 [Gordonia spumicola]|uniref:Acetyl-CoA acetyltransferase n=1 Tax=Gordonia spumicola TaxID=589161 RepID=A0A7I9V8X2_9ACTN|nr:hypothetical protein [Gordonia spumicola]GEE01692.1 hypothetical protein nbrc107696_21380 [Gordonia spumicola]